MAARDPAHDFELLSWDSAFFGLRIGRYTGGHLTRDRVDALKAWAEREDIDCLYYLEDLQHAGSLRLAERAGFRLTDIRVQLTCPLPAREREPGVGPETTRPHRDDDVPTLCRIAAVSHHDSRFYHDGGFDRERCDALYETWIRNSCAGYADEVLVVTAEGAPVGYLSCHVDSASTGRIGLTAVDAAFRGRSLGSQLIRASLQWFTEKGCEEVGVTTQARNTGALRFYAESGFRPQSIQAWFHFWPQRPPEV